MKKLLLLCALLLPLSANAGSFRYTYNVGTLLNAVALNGAAATRTFTVGPTLGTEHLLLEYSVIDFTVDYTEANAGTLTLTCTKGATAATATTVPTTCTTSGGTCTLAWAGVMVTPSLSASKKFSVQMRLFGAEALSCVIAHGGAPNGSDLVTVTATVLGE